MLRLEKLKKHSKRANVRACRAQSPTWPRLSPYCIGGGEGGSFSFLALSLNALTCRIVQRAGLTPFLGVQRVLLQSDDIRAARHTTAR